MHKFKDYSHKANLAIKEFSFQARFGLTLISKLRIPTFISILCLIIWKIQSFSVSMFFSCIYLEDPTFPVTLVMKEVSKGFIYGEIFNYTQPNGLGFLSFLFFQFYTWITIVLGIVQALEAYKIKRLWKQGQKYWSQICYFHPLIFSFPMFAFHVKLLYIAGNSSIIFGYQSGSGTSSIIVALSVIALVWDLGFYGLIDIMFPVPMKTKDLLSSKTKVIFAVEMIEKMFLYLIYVIVPEGSGKIWLLFLTNLAIIIARLYFSFDILPYYKIIATQIDTSMTSITGSLVVLNMVGWLIKGKYDFLPKRFLILSWILFIPIVLKSNLDKLNAIITDLLQNYQNANPFKLVHYISLVKSTLDIRNPIKENIEKFKMEELFFAGKGRSILMKDSDQNVLIPFNYDNKDHLHSYIKAFLVHSIQKHPEFQLIKVAYIHYLLQIDHAFLEVAHLLMEIKNQQPKLKIEICLLILRKKLEKDIQKKSKEKAGVSIDMKRYIEINEEYQTLQSKILEQAKEQLKFWKQFGMSEINFQNIRGVSCQVEKYKEELETIWKSIESFNERNFSAPYFLYWLYLDMLNNTPSLATKFRRQNYGIFLRYENDDDLDKLNQENLFHRDNFQIEVSAKKDELGNVVTCSPNAFELIGHHREDVVGRNISVIMPPFFQKTHDNSIQMYFDTGRQRILDKTRKVFASNREGFIFPILIHVKQNPSLEKALTFVALMRKLKDNNDYIIILGDGTIDAMSKGIAKTLKYNIEEKGVSIHEFCKTFKDANEAFNVEATNIIKKNTKPVNLIFKEFREFDDEKKEPIRNEKTLTVSVKLKTFDAQREELKESPTLPKNQSAIVEEEVSTDRKPMIKGPLTALRSNISSERRGSIDPTSLLHNRIKNEGTPIDKKKSMAFQRKKTITKNPGNSMWSRLQFLSGLNTEQVAKTTKQFKEGGAELHFFRRNDNLHPIKCFVRVETEIYDGSWIHILTFTDVQKIYPDEESSQEENNNHLDSSSSDIDKIQASGELNSLKKTGLDQAAPGKRIGQTLFGKTFTSKDTTLHSSGTGLPLKKPLPFLKQILLAKEKESPLEVSAVSNISEFDEAKKEKIAADFEKQPDEKQEKKISLQFNLDKIQHDKESSPIHFDEDFPTESEGRDDMPLDSYIFMKDSKKTSTGDSKTLKLDFGTSSKSGTAVTTGTIIRKNSSKKKIPGKLGLVNAKSTGVELTVFKKLKDKKEEEEMRNDASSVASSVTGRYRINRMVEEAIDFKYKQRKMVGFQYTFVFIVALIQCLVLGLGSHLISAQDGMKAQNTIMQLVYNRTDMIVQADFLMWEMDLIITQNSPYGLSQYMSYLSSLQTLGLEFAQNNLELRDSVSTISISLQNEFYSQVIKMYDLDDNIPLNSTENEYFEAFQKLYTSILIVNRETSVVIPSNNSEIDYYLYNSLNDIILRSQQLANSVQSELSQVITQNRTIIYIISGFCIIILGIYVLISFWILSEMFHNYSKFSEIYRRISDEDAKYSVSVVESFIESIEEGQIPEEKELARMKTLDKTAVKLSKVEKKINLTEAKSENLCLMAKLWPSFLVVGVIIVVAFVVSYNGNLNVETYQNRIALSSQNLYTTDLQNVALLEMIATNGTRQILDNLLVDEINNILLQISQMSNFVNAFKDSNGNIESSIMSLLTNYSCSAIPIASINQECNMLSNSNNYVNLVDLFTKYYQNSENLLESYLISTPSVSNTKTFVSSHISQVYNVDIVLHYLIGTLWSVTNNIFINYLSSQRLQLIGVLIGTSVLSFLVIIITTSFIFGQLVNQDSKNKKILKLIPIPIVIKNLWIKTYLVETSGKLGDNLRRAI